MLRDVSIKFGKREGTTRVCFLKIYPESDLSEQRLAHQKRSIVKNHLLTVFELDNLRQQMLPESYCTSKATESLHRPQARRKVRAFIPPLLLSLIFVQKSMTCITV